MPYALIPKDYTLEKVTRAQESAVRSKRRHDDIIAILSNENAALGITALASIVASGALLSALLGKLDDVKFSEKDKAKVESAFLDASILALPISPIVFAPLAAKGTADRLSKFLTKTITKLEEEDKILGFKP